MKTLLVFSYYYPPQKGIGGKRMYRLLSRLASYGWRSIVLTTPWPPSDDRDLEQPLYAPDVALDRGYVPEWFWRLYHAEGGSDFAPKGLAKRLSALARLLGYPIDGKVWLAPFAYCRALAIAREHKIDAVLSTSAPYSSHLAAMQVAQKLSVPFYADFRDPWTFNFLWRDRAPLQKRLDAFAERLVLERSTQTFLAATSTEQKYRLLYPEFAEKFRTIYSGFERDAVPSVSPWPNERPRLAVAHFGRFYGVRRTTHMLAAISSLIRDQHLTPQMFQLLTLGEIQLPDQDQLRAAGLLEFFPVSPMMPYEKGLSLLRGADVLFLCDYDLEPYFVPGKLFDYLRVGRPIFALSANPELRSIIHQTQTGRALHPEDTQGQTLLWKQIYEQGAARALNFAPKDVEAFSSDTAAEQLANALVSIRHTGAALR